MQHSSAIQLIVKSFSLASLAAATACSRVQSTAIAEPVGPGPTSRPSGDLTLPHIVGLGGGPAPLAEPDAEEGRLIVHTDVATDPAIEVQHQDGKRLPYAILDGNQRILATIQPDGQAPAVVELPPGDYLLRAEMLGGGTVDIKVRIARAQTTDVILDGSVARLGREADREAVRGTDGRFIGWRASPAK